MLLGPARGFSLGGGVWGVGGGGGGGERRRYFSDAIGGGAIIDVVRKRPLQIATTRRMSDNTPPDARSSMHRAYTQPWVGMQVLSVVFLSLENSSYLR
jgi:hypothetical protein